jgi:esterase/lipase superfamily enzyme
VGQGAWERLCLAETRRLSEVLSAKGVPHWLDLWGHDVNHDRPWWHKQLPDFLGHVLS